jgi:hypothetical protein
MMKFTVLTAVPLDSDETGYDKQCLVGEAEITVLCRAVMKSKCGLRCLVAGIVGKICVHQKPLRNCSLKSVP